MDSIDPFGSTDRLEDEMLEAMVDRLEVRGEHSLFSRMIDEYLGAMNIEEANAVLDIGCGTGLIARTIARRPGFSGQVIGVDLSPFLIEAAKRLAREEGVHDRTEFRSGDVHDLVFSDRSFDAVVAHTLLSHVDDPTAVLSEVERVLMDGGTVGIFDGDYASLTFDHEDPAKGKTYDEILISALVANPRIMRRMPRLLRAAGLELRTPFSNVLSEVGTADFWTSAIDAYQKLLPISGMVNEEEAKEWAKALRSDSEQGVFFGSTNYYAYVAERS